MEKRFVDLPMLLWRGFRGGPVFQTKSVKLSTGTTKEVGRWETFFSRKRLRMLDSGARMWIPPAHFVRGGRTVDQITLKEMIMPLVVIDVHTEVAKNADYTLSVERVKKWEVNHGAIPASLFVALRTDWSKRRSDGPFMQNKDAQSVAHYTG